MKYLIALISALFLAACATNPLAQVPAQQLIWKLDVRSSYEAANPGLGTSARYSSRQAWIDVYRYDLNRSNWVTGVADPQFSSHFYETIEEVKRMEVKGAYKNVAVSAPKEVVISNQTFRSVNFTYEVNGRLLNSTTYLTALNGRLLKYRISVYPAVKVNLDDLAIEFIKFNLDSPLELIVEKTCKNLINQHIHCLNSY